MKKILFGILSTLLIIFIYSYIKEQADKKRILTESSMLIQEQLRNTSKLVVTEGHFTEVYRYKDARELFGKLLSAEKKALVVVNAEVQVLYDLSKLEVTVDSINKEVQIKAIPKPELKIFPDFEYYDVSADYLNPFEAKDYNQIKENVKASLRKKIKASNLQKNARNRLLSELAKLYIVTSSRGWTLTYRGNTVTQQEKWQELIP